MDKELLRKTSDTLDIAPVRMSIDIPISIEKLAAAAFEAGYDRAALTLFAVAELLRADQTGLTRQ